MAEDIEDQSEANWWPMIRRAGAGERHRPAEHAPYPDCGGVLWELRNRRAAELPLPRGPHLHREGLASSAGSAGRSLMDGAAQLEESAALGAGWQIAAARRRLPNDRVITERRAILNRGRPGAQRAREMAAPAVASQGGPARDELDEPQPAFSGRSLRRGGRGGIGRRPARHQHAARELAGRLSGGGSGGAAPGPQPSPSAAPNPEAPHAHARRPRRGRPAAACRLVYIARPTSICWSIVI